MRANGKRLSAYQQNNAPMKRLFEIRSRKVFEMIQPKQAAETLEVSTSTLRRWASEFTPFLSPRKGTKRLYTTGDLAIFGRIKELYQQGLTTDSVREALPVIQAQPSPGDKALITLSDFSQALEILYSDHARVQAQLKEQAELIKAMKEKIDHLEKPWFKRLLKQKKG